MLSQNCSEAEKEHNGNVVLTFLREPENSVAFFCRYVAKNYISLRSSFTLCNQKTTQLEHLVYNFFPFTTKFDWISSRFEKIPYLLTVIQVSKPLPSYNSEYRRIFEWHYWWFFRSCGFASTDNRDNQSLIFSSQPHKSSSVGIISRWETTNSTKN